MERADCKTCLVCDKILRGRSDKLYCDAACKSAFHYVKRLKENNFYFRVDKILKTNRKILKRYNRKGYTTVRKDKLLNDGFNPNYFTHYYKNSTGDAYLFVYEYGILNLRKKAKYLIVEWQDFMQKSFVSMRKPY